MAPLDIAVYRILTQMKRAFSSLILTGSILTSLSLFPLPLGHKVDVAALAQTQSADQLFYIYNGQQIPLTQRQDAVAVEFKTTSGTRGVNPLYVQLEKDLQSGTRSVNSSLQVAPIGEKYALVSFAKGTRSIDIQNRIQSQSYVKTSLPVLNRSGSKDTIILPNEIIVSFKSGISDSERESILKQKNLTVIRPLRFYRNMYIVKSTTEKGVGVLNVANQLNQVQGVSSVTPNFLQLLAEPIKNIKNLNNQTITKQNKDTTSTDYLGFEWHLNSTPLQECLQQRASSLDTVASCVKEQKTKSTSSKLARTDMRVTDAWKHSNKGRDVVVAVIDSLIQWNHPDLQNSIYTVTSADKCPGEVHGWDFSEPSDSTNPCEVGDSDTRMSPLELTILRRKFQDSFKLSDSELIKRYAVEANDVQEKNPQISQKELAENVRFNIRTYEVGAEFHGTWVSGVIAANPQTQGILGVAPNAKILPVRVFGINKSVSNAVIVEAIGYAADRGADIINLSLGGGAPSDAAKQAITQILQEKPNLVIVASSGNEYTNEVSYPAAYPGVLSVGASNILGQRAAYSNYGTRLDVIAPGGDYDTPGLVGGIATTGGIWMDTFWQGLDNQTQRWAPVLDMRGKYWWVQGTSFSSPAVAGVIALMKGEDTNKKLTRTQIINILKSTASYDGLNVSKQEQEYYSSLVQNKTIPTSVTDKQYFFGSGLVNADAAVGAVQK